MICRFIFSLLIFLKKSDSPNFPAMPDYSKTASRIRVISASMIIAAAVATACTKPATTHEGQMGADEGLFFFFLVSFSPFEKNPVFTGTATDT